MSEGARDAPRGVAPRGIPSDRANEAPRFLYYYVYALATPLILSLNYPKTNSSSSPLTARNVTSSFSVVYTLSVRLDHRARVATCIGVIPQFSKTNITKHL